MTMPVDVKLLRFDTVRCALAIAAFGVIGGLAWFNGDRDEARWPPATADTEARADARPAARP